MDMIINISQCPYVMYQTASKTFSLINLQMEFASAGHEKKSSPMNTYTDPRKKQLLQMLGLLTLFFINNPQDLAYILSTLEGKGYKAYNDILGENF